MKILVLNGSPKGNKSITLKVTKAFLEGLNNNDDSKKIINLYEKDINFCRGCYHCWNTKEGKCVFNDDVEELINTYLESDLIIWSFPIYAHGIPAKMKAFLERMLPIDYPYIENRSDGGSKHVHKYDRSHHKYIVISSAGLYSRKNNYESVVDLFNILFANNYEMIVCCEAELFKVDLLKNKVNRYLRNVKCAGDEYKRYGYIPDERKAKLLNLMMNSETYIETSNSSWGLDKE